MHHVLLQSPEHPLSPKTSASPGIVCYPVPVIALFLYCSPADSASLKYAAPPGVYVTIAPGDPTLWSGVLFVRSGGLTPLVRSRKSSKSS